MKKMIPTILLCLSIVVLFAGCSNQETAQPKESQMVAIANPWSNWDSMEEAEAATGFSFGLPEVIAESFTATEFRTMNGELMEVVYFDGDFEVCIRKAKGENQDISGDYNQYESCTEENRDGAAIATYYNSANKAVKQIISYDGYSWSLMAPNGYWGDSNEDFVNGILGE